MALRVSREAARVHLLIIILLGVCLRIVIAPLFGGFGYDMNSLANWSWHLQHTPLDQFYAYANSPDHLPGDLWFLMILAKTFHTFGGRNFESDIYLFLLKMIPTVADVAIALLLYALVSRLRNQSAALIAAGLFLLNPATIFLTAVWGQWDSVSMALLLAGFWIIVRFPHYWLLAIPLLAWSVLIKPPLAPMVLLALLIPVSDMIRTGTTLKETLRRLVLPVITAAALGVLTILVLILPFGIGLPGIDRHWRLLDRVGVALDLYQIRTMSAFNIWMIAQGSMERRSDLGNLIAGVSSHTFGNLLLIVALGLIFAFVGVTLIWRTVRAPATLIVWSMLAASIAVFMLPTRVHERYLFPAIVLSILLVGLTGVDQRALWIAVAISLSYLFNLLLVYGGFRNAIPDGLGAFVYGPMLVLLSIANLAIFVAVILWPPGEGGVSAEPDAARR